MITMMTMMTQKSEEEEKARLKMGTSESEKHPVKLIQ